MNLASALLQLYPEASPLCDYIVVEDENGIVSINEWHLPFPQPTQEQLVQASLAYTKSVKIEELTECCREVIVAGFTSQTTGHTYDYEDYDQLNMADQFNLLQAFPSTTTVDWKTRDGGVISHTVEQFRSVYLEGFTHKHMHVQRFRALKAQVEAATTDEQVAQIVW